MLQLLPERLNIAAEIGTAHWTSVFGPASTQEPTVVIGAGGSHPAAEYLARLLRQQGCVARAAYPLDAHGPERRLIAVSYSGGTPDIAKAITDARQQQVTDVVLITGNLTPKLGDMADHVLWHRDGRDSVAGQPERGYLSFAATVAPCAAALAACGIPGSLDDLATHVANPHRAAPCLDVIGTGWAWPAALDLESKWTEAALGVVRLHEAKNLSHGRYLSILDRDTPSDFVILRCGKNDYLDELEVVLSRHGRILSIQSTDPGPAGGLAVLNAVQPLAVKVGAARHMDVSRPAHIPADGVQLYSWAW